MFIRTVYLSVSFQKGELRKVYEDEHKTKNFSVLCMMSLSR